MESGRHSASNKSKFYSIQNYVEMVLIFGYLHDSVRNYYMDNLYRHYQLYKSQQADMLTNRMSDESENPDYNEPKLRPKSKQDNIVSDPDDDYFFCPLKEIGKHLRIYNTLSNVYMIMALFKYAIVCIILYIIYQENNSVECYFIGRIDPFGGFLFELPLFSIIIASYNLIYRFFWIFVVRKINLECFILAAFDEKYVQQREDQLDFMNQNKHNSHLLYLKNLMFYQRIDLGNGKYKYIMREIRSVSYRRRLSKFIMRLSTLWFIIVTIMGFPLSSIGLYNVFSNQHFDLMYRKCRFVTGRDVDDPNFVWKYTDPYRLLGFVIDMVDSLILGFATYFSVICSLLISIISVYDISNRLSILIRRLDKLKRALIEFNYECETWKSHLNRDEWITLRQKQYDILYFEVKCSQNELMESLEQVNETDKFIRLFSVFCIHVFLFMNIIFQVISMIRGGLFLGDTLVNYFQAMGFIILTLYFLIFSRTYSQGTELYRHLCTIAAVDQNLTTKRYWIWFLQYYDEEAPSFSFHFGLDIHPLSMNIYFRSVTWFFSLGLLTTNLLRWELNNFRV